jgi:hypothetical protein
VIPSWRATRSTFVPELLVACFAPVFLPYFVSPVVSCPDCFLFFLRCRYWTLIRANLEKALKANKEVTKNLRKEVAASKRTAVPLAVEFSKRAASRLPAGIRERVMGAEKDAAVALGCLRKEVSQHKKTLLELNLAQADLNAMVAKLVPNTNWIDKCGKKGERYDIFIIEMGLQLVSQNMNAEQCVYAFGVFMQMTYPTLTAGDDYRLPSVSAFKEWGEMLYPIAAAVNRSRLDLAVAIYYHHDDSPRGGYSWHGSTSVCTFKDADGHMYKEHIPLGIEVLPNGKHANMAAEGVSIMGPNLRKMCLVMSDAAALDVARMMYDSKDELVRDLTGVAWSQVHLILLTFFGLPFFTVPFPPSPSPRRDPGRQRDKRDELRSPVHQPRRG